MAGKKEYDSEPKTNHQSENKLKSNNNSQLNELNNYVEGVERKYSNA